MRIAEVALVRQAEVDLGLIEGVRNLVGEDTRRETRDDLLRATFVRALENVVVDQEVISQECQL